MAQPLSPLDSSGLQAAVTAALAAFTQASSGDELRAAKTAHLGAEAPLTLASRAMRAVEPSQRAAAGQALGAARNEVTAAFDARYEEVAAAEREAQLLAQTVDVTTAGADRLPGARHPLNLVIEDMSDFFTGLGWSVEHGPEIEHEWFNFDALNFDIDHPARQMQDTFYVDDAAGDHLIMRTHTSPVQARTMLRREPPLYIACPGKVFRSDELDQTHTPVFHQIEGLAVDEGLTMAHLKGTLEAFARAMFGPRARIRLRPSFFPFTEPSAEMDVWFEQKKGGPGWIEWGGCGMVNPNVLRACGIDAERYSGFAFGMGIERTLMLRHSIADMHDIVEGDIRFSQQFGVNGKGN